MDDKKEILFKKLEDHFTAAARKNPQQSFTFMEELGIYKGALLDNNPLCLEILRLRAEQENEISARPAEVVEVFKKGFRIYSGRE